MLSPLSSPPTYISPQEHDTLTSSTPSDFSDIPPILQFADEEAEVALFPPTGFPGWTSKVKGQLWVTEAAVAFLPSDGLPGFSLSYPSLILHALTPASSESAAHVYCQIDESDEGGLDGNANDQEEGEDDYAAMREARIYVADDRLQALFAALSQCSALHASLLPNGEPSSFFGFGDMAEGLEEDDDDDEGQHGYGADDQDNDGDDGDGEGDGRRDPATAASMGNAEKVDQVDRFLDMVDWGNVKKPAGWDGDGQRGEFDDAEE